MFTLEINTDNAAFEGEYLPLELARILREVARWIDTLGVEDHRGLYDVNGNLVGQYNYAGGVS